MNANGRTSIQSRTILAIVIGVYALSFFLPVIDSGTPREIRGYQAFGLALVSVVYLPQWLANPVLWFGLLSLGIGRYRLARNAGLVASMFAVSQLPMWDDRPEIGFWVWSGSMLLLTTAAAVQSRHDRPPNRP